jgi:hypothetical protein
VTLGRRPSELGIGLYTVGFLLMLAAALMIAVASIGSLRHTGLLWVSSGLSCVAIVLSVVALVLPQREI